MCGIAGIFVPRASTLRADVALPAVQDMTRSMVHRGPDGYGHWADETGRCFLGHRRLSIIDTSDAGLQPMDGADGRWVITFNGEIYNYQELKPELQAAGVQFKGRTDTEVLLEAVALWGVDALPRLDGMFAFAAFDRLTGRILIARDAFGEKPLYYTTLDSGAVAFASELQALEKLPGFNPAASLDAMAEMLSFQYIGAPRSIYQSVRKLAPGCWMEIDSDGAFRTGRFYDFQPTGGSTGSRTMADLADELEDILVRSLRRRLISDVPLGAFLSGGVDSSVVAALVRRKLKVPLKTFSTGFSNAPESEHLTARIFAEHLGCEHRENLVSPDVSGFLERAGDLLDEPNGDSSCLPTFLLSEFVRQHVTVAVSGDGGDELFGGYGRYFATLDERDRALSGALENYRPGQVYYGNRILVGQEPLIQELFGMVPDAYAAHLARLRGDIDAGMPGGLLEAMRRSDVENYMPGAVLPKVDRMSMRNSLEVRTPFLNMELARFASSLPESVLVQKGRGKLVLREVAYRYLPKELIDLPKQGFGLPMSDWARDSLLSVGSTMLLDDDSRLGDALGRDRLGRYLEHQATPGQFSAYQLWGVVVLEAWLRKHPAEVPKIEARSKAAVRPRKRLDALPLAADLYLVAEADDTPGRDPLKNPAFDHLQDRIMRRFLELVDLTKDNFSAARSGVLPLPYWGEPGPESLFGLEGATLLFADHDAMSRFDHFEYRKLVKLGVRRVGFNSPFDPQEYFELEFNETGGFKRLMSRLRLFQRRIAGSAASRKMRRMFKLDTLKHGEHGTLMFGPAPALTGPPDTDMAAQYALFEGGRQLLPLRSAHSQLSNLPGRYSIWNQMVLFSSTDPARTGKRPYWVVPMDEKTRALAPIRLMWRNDQYQPRQRLKRDIQDIVDAAGLTQTPVTLRRGDRVVVCTHGLPPGGAERQWVYLAQALEEAGYDVVFVTFGELEGANRHYLPDLVASGIKHVDASTIGFREQMQLFHKYPLLEDLVLDRMQGAACLLGLAWVFDHLKPKAVFTQLDQGNLLAGYAGLAVGVPRVVLSFRNYNPTNFPYLQFEWMLEPYRALVRSPNIAMTGNFSGANDDYAAWIGVEPGRVHHVPNAIEPSLFPIPADEQVAETCEQLRLPAGAKVVLGVFRLSAEKDPMLFVRVCERLCREDPDVVALIAGIGPMKAEMEKHIAKAGLKDRIRLLGSRSDVNVLTKLATLLLHTSRHEGMPNAVMEAQFMGLPVVATRAGGTGEVVVDGKTALLAAIGDLEGLYAHCRAVLDDPAKARALGAAARSYAREAFQKRQMGQRYLRVVDPTAAVEAAIEEV